MSLSYEVFDLDFPAGSPNKTAVLVMGEKDAILVDAGFTRADGHRLVAGVLDSGKRLTTVFVSHADPDFYFGLEAVVDAFPGVDVVATETVAQHIARSFEGKLQAWADLGANLPTRRIEIAPLSDAFLEIEGHRLELRGGSDALPDRHYLWSAEDRTIFGGVLIFQQEHVWTADTPTAEKRAAWVSLLDEMTELDPVQVIAGHRLPGAASDASAIEYTREYLHAFEQVLAEAEDAAAATGELVARYPESGMLIAAQIGPKVARGEMTWG